MVLHTKKQIYALIFFIFLVLGLNFYFNRDDEQVRSESEAANNEALRQSVVKTTGHDFQNVRHVFVLPGGGPGDEEDNGLPLWTKQRVDSAVQAYKKEYRDHEYGTTIFLALSAGSMNAPSPRKPDGHILLESAAIQNYLAETHKINPGLVVCDYQSWDTVGNAVFARTVIETILRWRSTSQPLVVSVYISDFHAQRAEVAFGWVFGLAPALPKDVRLDIKSVSSEGVKWSSKDFLQERKRHEEKGRLAILENKKVVRTMKDLNVYLLLGGHAGYYKFTHGNYVRSKGGGW